jgi:tRNA A37 threonylcarbamoyladenosine dehydratase
MSQRLINLNPDLKRLRDEGFEIEIKGAYLLVHHVPYLNSSKEIKYGTLVSNISMNGEKTIKPDPHVAYFIGDYPCNKDGTPILQIQHQNTKQRLMDNLECDFSFSNKPSDGYQDYYEKMTTYSNIISGPAKSLNDSVTEKTFRPIISDDQDDVFKYFDTYSSRANICCIADKLRDQKVAIVGLGGTGSYILDFMSKTRVKEIHLFDSDEFLQHNAFRFPGAPTIQKFDEHQKKIAYLHEIYSNMHRHIYTHPYNISIENVVELRDMNFVFLCIDKAEAKKDVIPYLLKNDIPFIDTGMGIHKVDDALIGMIRVTSCTKNKRDHIEKRISYADMIDDVYSENIQIAELNAINAALAVIKWKKISGYYQDLIKENNITMTLNTGQLDNEDCEI